MKTGQPYQPTLFETALLPAIPAPVLLDAQAGRDARDAGIAKAEASTEEKEPGWMEQAYKLFKQWLDLKPVGYFFLIEDCRAEILKFLPTPTTNRVFGGIAVKARKMGLIEHSGQQVVKNLKAHRCYANRWRKI